jgi:hypothetical protein
LASDLASRPGKKRTPDRRWARSDEVAAADTVHRWWYRMLEQAGLAGHGVRLGLNMHRARNTFATELRRAAGVEAASKALGCPSPNGVVAELSQGSGTSTGSRSGSRQRERSFGVEVEADLPRY